VVFFKPKKKNRTQKAEYKQPTFLDNKVEPRETDPEHAKGNEKRGEGGR
jgi:hypothetical protein